jgi:MFS family permease
MKEKKFRNYIVFWLSQSISQLGSSITNYALIIWVYQQTGSAMTVSLMTFCSFLPYILVSLFAGPFIDRHSKKNIMAVADTAAALCSAGILILLHFNMLDIWHIYLVNFIIGAVNSFQHPASSVAIGIMVPEGMYDKASGMDSFTTNLVTVAAPMLGAAVFTAFGMVGVILIDLCTFVFAITVLILFVDIKEVLSGISEKAPYFSGIKEGFDFLKCHKGILNIMLTMAIVNFFSRLTYENILPPMLLARSNGNTFIYGIVSAVLGIGGIAGGLIVACGKFPKNHVKMIYLSAAYSFLFGDLLMGLGRNVYVWTLAGLAASIPIPFIIAGQRVLMYENVPQNLQGRVFAVRNAVQFSTIPVGILLGGVLADYVFEPFMASDHVMAGVLEKLVGSGSGSGMALMFLCTGCLGCAASLIGYNDKEIRKLIK